MRPAACSSVRADVAWGRFVTARDSDGSVYVLQELAEYAQGYANRPDR